MQCNDESLEGENQSIMFSIGLYVYFRCYYTRTLHTKVS